MPLDDYFGDQGSAGIDVDSLVLRCAVFVFVWEPTPRKSMSKALAARMPWSFFPIQVNFSSSPSTKPFLPSQASVERAPVLRKTPIRELSRPFPKFVGNYEKSFPIGLDYKYMGDREIICDTALRNQIAGDTVL